MLNTDVAPTAEFVLHQTQSFNAFRIARTLREAVKGMNEAAFARLAEAALGDAIFANMMLVGFAWQAGLLPLRRRAIEQAIRLNGAAVNANILAFAAGRLLSVKPELFEALLQPAVTPADMPLDERIDFLAGELTAYQDAAYAETYRNIVAQVRAAEHAAGLGEKLTRAAATYA